MENPDLRGALQRHFGHAAFRKGQEAIVRSVLSGRPTIAILPTGGGKSLCYQLPALLLEGTTVVVSPLVALMKDQVDALRARGIAATFVNSSVSESERQERQAALRRGELRLVYVAPERFRSSTFVESLKGLRVPLLAVDEAHCISAWGHDFRPEYQRIASAREAIRAERILALTATATPEVRDDIQSALRLDDPRVFVAGFDRPNLFIEVLKTAGDKDKLGRLVSLARREGPGLVYAGTRKNVEKIVGALRGAGVDALGYHAGMEDGERSRVQERFVRGEVPVVAATNAFGMGVDKADIRFVAHFDVPRSLEAYYQEIGRAGRDGAPSYALLFFNWADVLMQRRMIDGGRASRSLVEQVWEAARRLRRGSIDELARAANSTAGEIQGAVRLLESAGHLERGRGREAQFSLLTPGMDAGELRVDFELLGLRVSRERAMLDRLVSFTDTRGCRRHNLLRYFGDDEAKRSCNACDGCAGSRAPEPDALPAKARAPRAARAAGPAEGEEPFDAAVFEKLRALRAELARDNRVPPYVIFHDSTLRELSRALPHDEASFLAVKGAGQGRWLRYGERVVAITGAAKAAEGTPLATSGPVAGAAPAVERGSGAARIERRAPVGRIALQKATRASEGVPEEPRGAESVPPAEEPPPVAHEPMAAYGNAPPPWVREERPKASDALWEMYEKGVSLEKLAQELKRPVPEVASELLGLANAGRRLDVERLLGKERVRAIRAAAKDGSGDVVALRKRLPFPAAIAEVRLALLPPAHGATS